jgi:ubiquinone/menaquinone biosynthesis C-methylase UbiE
MTDQVKQLGQYPTPLWVCEEIVDRYFSNLGAGDVVLEPSCGTGNFLMSVPAAVPAVGVEIDSRLAEIARARTGREVITGDFRNVELNLQPTAIIGNPPFNVKLIEQFMGRAYRLLPEGGRMGFLLPAYMFQTASRFCQYAEQWSIRQEMVPKHIYPDIQAPLIFALFSKDRHRTLVGFALYTETLSTQSVKHAFRKFLTEGDGNLSAWRAVTRAALLALGGEADLSQIYNLVGTRRPTANQWWREKVRQTLQKHFKPVSTGRWAIC